MQYLSVFITYKKKKNNKTPKKTLKLQVIISALGTYYRMELEINLAKSCLQSVINVFLLDFIKLSL